ncbi:hypothetical protein T11_5492 [Trichinella zimbabwensis]|uniref:Uncharacterized protein n=1 Tax=Trichinella zimbabwensis TaxID=268475 RepID=A0A0V1GCA7_9BILA|nr:hypothetical protein T11_5492 [Trichinella zimbabwensis]
MRFLYELLYTLCKSAQINTPTNSGIRTSGRFHCQFTAY